MDDKPRNDSPRLQAKLNARFRSLSPLDFRRGVIAVSAATVLAICVPVFIHTVTRHPEPPPPHLDIGPGANPPPFPSAADVPLVEEGADDLSHALDLLCNQAHDPSSVLAQMQSRQSLIASVLAPVSSTDVEFAFSQFRGFCDAIALRRRTAEVVGQFQQKIQSIERRVDAIGERSCGPRFTLNWDYHIGRLESENGSLEEYDRVARQFRRALSYYESVEEDTCRMTADMDAELSALKERLDFDRRPNTLRLGLRNLRGDGLLEADVFCALFLEETGRYTPAGRHFADMHTWVQAGFQLATWFWVGGPLDGRPLPPAVLPPQVWLNCPRSLLVPTTEGVKQVSSESPGFPVRVHDGELHSDWPASTFLHDAIDTLCVDRLTTSVEEGRRLFTEGLPPMDVAQRDHYRDVFDELLGRRRPVLAADARREVLRIGDAADDRAAVKRWCAAPDYTILWSVVERILDSKYSKDVDDVLQQYSDEFARAHGLQTYVGRGLQTEINLRRMYELEYVLTPEDVEDPTEIGDRQLRELIAQLRQEYRTDVEAVEGRAHAMALEELKARTQIQRAVVDANGKIAVAIENSRGKIIAAQISQRTAAARLRAAAAQKRDFFGQFLGAVAPALGEGLVEGVLDTVLFPGDDSTGAER